MLVLEQMDAWLVDTGLNVEGGAFDIAGIVLRIDDRAAKFMPVFLSSQGVTGCMEVTFYDGGNVTSQGRLLIRSGTVSD